MNKIKTIKIKNEDGSVSEESYSIAADALNIDMANGKNVQETIGTIDVDKDGNIAAQLNKKINKSDIIDNLNSSDNNKVLSAKQGKVLNEAIAAANLDIQKKIYYFNTVEDMKAADLQAGDTCQTLGYYEENDGGAGLYKIVDDDTLVDDGGSMHELENGLKAELIIEDSISPEQFGAKGDGINNDTLSIQTCLNSAIGKNTWVLFSNKIYNITQAINLNENVNFLSLPHTKFTNPRYMPTTFTNANHQLLENYLVSFPENGTKSYGDSTITVEVVPKDNYIGNAVAGFFGGLGKGNCDVWALNPIVRADDGFTGRLIGIEVDIDALSGEQSNDVSGILVNGVGQFSNTGSRGIWITRGSQNSTWDVGLFITQAKNGIIIENPNTYGILVRNKDNNAIILQRASSSEANIFTIVNEDNTSVISSITNLGKANFKKLIIGNANNSSISGYNVTVPDITIPSIPAHSTIDLLISNDFETSRYKSINANLVGSNVPSSIVWSVFSKNNKPYLRIANISDTATLQTTCGCVCQIFTH